MPDDSPAMLTRRRFVAVTAGLAGLVAAGGCTTPADEPDVDPLTELARAATRDARELAAANSSHGSHADGLRRVGRARAVQAERLTAEVDRLDPGSDTSTDQGPGTATPTADPATGDAGGGASPVCPPVEEVRARLRADATAAAGFAAGVEGYRAALAASVSAACITALEVELA